RVIGLCRSSYRYEPRREEPMDLLRELRQIASERPRFGYRRLHALLRRRGYRVNHKRVYRLYRQENLVVRRQKRKRVAASLRSVPLPPGSKRTGAASRNLHVRIVSPTVGGGTSRGRSGPTAAAAPSMTM